jgi:hypothetical protein
MANFFAAVHSGQPSYHRALSAALTVTENS